MGWRPVDHLALRRAEEARLHDGDALEVPTDFPSTDAMRRYLTLLALYGAAVKDATNQQRIALKGSPALMLRDHDVPLADVVVAVFKVMGQHWRPTDQTRFDPWLYQYVR